MKTKGKNGGARPGAGRRDGQVKLRTQKTVAKYMTDGDILPIDVMMNAMRHHYNVGNLREAASFARDAAPYLHPRLQSTELKGPNNQPLIPPDIQITFVKKKVDACAKPTDNQPSQTPAPDSKRD